MTLIPGFKRVYIEGIDDDVSIDTHSFIWNTSTLAWEKATGSAGAGNVTVTNFPATYPATQSGAWTVTANAGTNLNTSALALDATLINSTQKTQITDGTDIVDVTATNALKVDSSAVTQPISAVALPLPTNAAIETGGHLASINANIDISLSTRLADSTFIERINTQGQKSMSVSTPVVIASDQSSISVSQSFPTIVASGWNMKLTDGIDTALINPTGSLQIIPDSTMLDAFGRFRVSSPYQILSIKEDLQSQSYYFTTSTSVGGTVTYNSARSSTFLATTTANGSTAIRQSKSYSPYQPGKSLQAIQTAVVGAGQTNTIKRWGYFDTSNGCFFQLSGTTLGVAIRSSAVDTVISQSSWNLDKLDGTGISGVLIDLTKAQIYIVDLQWLGVGRVRFGVGVGGQTIYCHEVNNANIVTGVYMRTANLPVRTEVTNIGVTAETSSFESICAQVSLEGGLDQIGFPYGATTGLTGKAIGGAVLTPLLILTPKVANPHPIFSLEEIGITCSAGATYFWGLYLNPTLTGVGPTFVSVHADSQLRYDVVSTAVVSGGKLLCSGSASTATRQALLTIKKENWNIMQSDFAGTGLDQLVLAVSQTGAASTYIGSINWIEYV